MVELPEVTLPEAVRTGSHISERVRMRGFSLRFFSYYSSKTKCWYTWPWRGSLGWTHAQPVSPVFSGVLTGNDVSRRAKENERKNNNNQKKKPKNKKQFEKVREKSTGKCFISSCTRKASSWYFKRCGLKKYGKMYCFLKSITRKTSNESI